MQNLLSWKLGKVVKQKTPYIVNGIHVHVHFVFFTF